MNPWMKSVAFRTREIVFFEMRICVEMRSRMSMLWAVRVRVLAEGDEWLHVLGSGYLR